jgi:hypothetical protein
VKDNIVVLDGGKTPNLTAEALREMRANMPLFLEHMAMMAELQRAKFDALKKNGFTDAQALDLCRSVF